MSVYLYNQIYSQILFQKDGIILPSYQALYEGSSCFTFLLTVAVVSLFNVNHSNRCEVVSYCGINFHFPSDYCCLA